MASRHNCFSSIIFQVGLEKRGSLTTKGVQVPDDWECPVCLEGKNDTSTSVTGCKCSKVACRLNTCNHLIHVGCYQSIQHADGQGLAVCPTCQVVPVMVETDADREKKAAFQVAVPDVIETVTLTSLHGQSRELHNVASASLVATLIPAILEIHDLRADSPAGRVNLISFNRPLELDKKLSDYPGLHLKPIFTTLRM